MVENVDIYGVFDNTTTDWIWEGTEEELLLTLKTENKHVENVADITFKGHRLFKEIETKGNINDIIMSMFRSRWLIQEYHSISSAVKPINIYKIEDQKLILINTFKILSKADLNKKVPYHYTNEYYTGPNFRNGPVKNVSKTYRFSNFYRNPNTAGVRKQLSRYNEDREYIKGLVKNLTYIDAWDDKPRTLTRSWKDKKIRHQWQKHKKK